MAHVFGDSKGAALFTEESQSIKGKATKVVRQQMISKSSEQLVKSLARHACLTEPQVYVCVSGASRCVL